MTTPLKLDTPETTDRLDAMAQGVLGAPLDRPEGPLKVSGRAPYAAEVLPEGVAWGVLVRATVARGRLADLRAEAVRSMPGVLAVLSDKRLLRNPAQGGAGKAPVQGVEEIAYVGQPIALVVAESFEQARHAALALTPAFEAEHAVVDPEAPDAQTERPEKKQHDQGDLDRAMAEAAFAVDVTYRTPSHASAAMEPHAAVASWEGDRLEVRSSLQMLVYNRKELADAVGIEPDKVHLLSPYVGGGFGSKLGISPEAVAAAIAAQQLGRPVAVVLSRQQVFEAVMRRSETRQRIRLAADADGRLTGIGHESLVSNLPGESFSEPVTQATHFLYGGANRRIVHEVARVNRTCAGSVRAPGEAVGVTVLESAMDELAEATGLDPVELRLRNIPDRHPEEDKPFSSHTLARALRRGAERFGWDRRNPRPGQRREGEWLIGLGMASAVRVNMLAEAQARVTLLPGPRALVESDMTDIGTGTYAVLTQVAAEMLGLPATAVETRLGDTDLPPGPGSGGSRGAASTSAAVFRACEILRERIATRMGADASDLTLRDGRAIAGNRSQPLDEIVDPEGWSVVGHMIPGKVTEAVRQATYGSHFVEVGVSAVTGEVRVRRMLGVFAAGRILNEKTARSQCLGGMTFGIGMALTEEVVHDPRDGHIVNRDLAEYHLPVNRDVPQLEVEFLEERDPWSGPLQAKGIGELSICGSAAAILNAIRNACGVRIRDYPATLDKVLAGLEAAGPYRGNSAGS
jgi:xanthine dehydrogenase YagR molybdenum-binding subunit